MLNFSNVAHELKAHSAPEVLLEKLLSSFDVEDYIEFKEDSYNRVVLYSDDQCELVLCCWGNGHKTEEHFHEGRKCWFRCVKGMLSESRGEGDVSNFKSGSWGSIDDSMGPHIMMNLSGDKTVSFHFYNEEV